MNKKSKKLLSVLLAFAMVASTLGFNGMGVFAAKNAEDVGTFLDFEASTVGTRPATLSSGAVKDGASVATGVIHYSAQAGRVDGYSYISSTPEKGKFFVYDTQTAQNQTGWYGAGFTYITTPVAATATDKVFVAEADMKFVKGNVNLMLSNTTSRSSSVITHANMVFNGGTITCGGASTAMTDKTFTGITNTDWYKLTMVYSIGKYVSYNIKKYNADGTTADLGTKKGVPTATGTGTIAAFALTNVTNAQNIETHVDNWNFYEVKPSSSLVLNVSGDSTLEKENLALETRQFTATIEHNSGDNIEIPLIGSLKPTWSLKTPVKGFSVNADGLLTADITTDVGTYPVTVVATCGATSAEAIINATVTRSTAKYYDVVVKYVDSQDFNRELKPSRIIPAQKQDAIVSASDSDKLSFDAFVGTDEFNCVYNETLSKVSVIADEYDFIMTVVFDKVLRTNVTIKYLDSDTGESIKADRIEARLLNGTSFTVNTSDKSAVKSGTAVYEYDKTSVDTVSVSVGAIINLYFTLLENEYFVYEDFDALPLNDVWGTTDLVAGAAKVTAESDRGNILQYSGGTSGNRGRTKAVTHSGTTVNVDFDFVIPAISGTSNYIELSDGAQVVSSIINPDSKNTILTIASKSAGALQIYDATTASFVNIGASFPAGSWTNVNAKLNFSTQKIETLTFKNASGQVADYSNLPFKKSGATGLKSINILGIRDGGGNVAMNIKLDNFKLYKKAGEFLITGFANGTLDTWAKTGAPTITYSNRSDNVPYATVVATTDAKATSAVFTTKGNVVTEYDFMAADSSAVASLEFIKAGVGVATSEVLTPVANTWYTVTSMLDFTNKKITTSVLNNQTNEVITTQKVTTNVDSIDNVTLNVGAGSTVSLADLKVIESTPKTINLVADNVLNVSESGDVSLDITANTTYKILTKQAVTDYVWDFEAVNKNGLSLIKKDGKTATLVATKDAKAQMVTITATDSGKIATKLIRIATSANSILFSQSSKDAIIPFEGSHTYQYNAGVVDGSMNPIDGKTLVWDLCDANLNPINPVGINLSNSGLLTVASSAIQNKIYVRATEASEVLYSIVPVNVHGYNYDFGLGGDSDVAEGFMEVTPITLYSDTTGFGLLNTGAVVAGGATDVDALKGDYLKTSTAVADVSFTDVAPTNARFTFLLDLPNGDYQVTANFKGSIFSEASQADSTKNNLIGALRVNNASDTMTEKVFKVAVVDGQLDLNFDCATDGYAKFIKPVATGLFYTPAVSSLQITKLATRVSGDKPTIYIIGDSTSNNGSQGWGNVANSHTYGLVNISNNGTAGRSFLSYYRQGRTTEVLVNIKPGDIVTVGHGINYDGDSSASDTALFNLIADGAIQRGATPIFLTPTPGGTVPNGVVRYYDFGTNILSKRNSGTGNTGRQIAQQRGILFIDVDQLGNDMFMSIPVATRLETIQASYTDHNHFSIQGAHFTAKLILDEIFKSSLFNYTPSGKVNVTCNYSALTADNKTTVTIALNNGSSKFVTPNIFIAEYASNGVLVGVEKADFVSSGTGNPISILPGVVTSGISETTSSIRIKDNTYVYTLKDPTNKVKTLILNDGTFEPLSESFVK